MRGSVFVHDLLVRLPVSDREIVQRAVEELVQHAQQFELATQLQRCFLNRLALQEIPQVLFSQQNAPENMVDRDSLVAPVLAEFDVRSLDIPFGFVEQPLGKVHVDFERTAFNFSAWNFLQFRTLGRILDFLDERMSQIFGMPFDKAD